MSSLRTAAWAGFIEPFVRESIKSERVNPLEARPTVKVPVEAEDGPYPMPLHNGDVNAIACRQQRRILHDLPRPQHVCLLDCQNIVYNIQQHVEGWPDRVSSADRGVTMNDLLQYLSVGHQTLSRRNKTLQQELRLGLVRVRGPNEVHRNVGVHENQG